MNRVRPWILRLFLFSAWTFFVLQLLQYPLVRIALRAAESHATGWVHRPFPDPKIGSPPVYVRTMSTRPGARNAPNIASYDELRLLPIVKLSERRWTGSGSWTHEAELIDMLGLDIAELPGVPAEDLSLRAWSFPFWSLDDWGGSEERRLILDNPPAPEELPTIPIHEIAAGAWDGRLKGAIVADAFNARAIVAVRDGRYLTPLPKIYYRWAWGIALVGFLALLFSDLAPSLRWPAYASMIILIVGSLIVRRAGYIPCFAYAEGYLFGGALLVGSRRLARHIQDRGRLHSAFRRYISRDVADDLLRKSEKEMLGGRAATLTVLFLDVRGFTSFAGRTPPEEVVRVLNHFFADMIEIVFAHKGTVSKLIGDALFAYFGEPLECDHAKEATAAAIEMVRAASRTLPEGITIGIGIHTGPVVVGNFGTKRYMEYTAVGETVRTAYALQNAAREHHILISEETLRNSGIASSAKEIGTIREDGVEVTAYAIES